MLSGGVTLDGTLYGAALPLPLPPPRPPLPPPRPLPRLGLRPRPRDGLGMSLCVGVHRLVEISILLTAFRGVVLDTKFFIYLQK